MEQNTHRYELTILNPLHPMERKDLSPDKPTSIGRSVECVIPIRDRYLSRHHIDLIPGSAGESWLVQDRGSANGTYVNGRRIEDRQPIVSGDRIRIGDTELVFHIDYRTDRFLSVRDEASAEATISIPVRDITGEIRHRLRSLA